MNKLRKNLYRYISCLLCLSLLLMMFPVSVLAKGSKREMVRIGWYEDSYNITGKKGQRSGYGYEYQQSVAAYTGWKYQYVKAGWSDLVKLIEKGKLDIMSGVSYTKERSDKMLFSELPMGKEKYYLYADLKHTNISASDTKTLDGKRVGLLKGSIQATQFYEWEKKHDLHLKHIYVTSFENAKKKVADRKLDCLVSTETPQLVENGMSATYTVGGSDIYFVINKKRPDLKEKLDDAMHKMEYDKPFYADELYQKYLEAVSNPVLSIEEKNWLKTQGKIRIGFLNNDGAISTFDKEDGEMNGVINDYITLSSKSLENQKLQFEIKGFDSLDEQLKALKDHKIDMIFHVSQNPYEAEKNGLSLSDTVLSRNMAAITSQRYFNEEKENKIAIQKGDKLLKWYIEYNYPKWKIIEKNSVKDLKRAVERKEADCFVVGSGQEQEYTENSHLHSVNLMQPYKMSFAVRLGDTETMSILNKTLKTMSSSMLSGAVSTYESSMKKVTVMDFVKDNLLAVALGFMSVFLVILMLVLGLLRKARNAEAKAKQETSKSLELNQKLQESYHELEEAVREAENANDAKTTFLSNMSHDIRTPMNAIVGITNLMEHEEGTSEKLKDYIQKVQASSRHLLGLINDILDMSRIEAKEIVLNMEDVNLAEQIGQIDSIIRAQTNEKNQTFDIYVDEIVHEYLICDGVRLRQIILNLLSNTVKYTPKGGKIKLELIETPCDIEGSAKFIYKVTDNGYGMTTEFMKHIFEPFTRGENSVTNKVQGTGLGMTITKNIVDLMGGEIHVESEIGKGSCFEVTLTLKINKNADHEVGVKRALLISEDDILIRNIKASMRESCVELACVPCKEEAIQWLRHQKAEVVLLTECCKNKNLPELVKMIREVSKEAMLIFCVDYAQEDRVKNTLMESGIDGIVMRPFFISNLALAIARTRTKNVTATKNSTVLKGKRFLCAEDNELNAEILKEILHMYGSSCTICADGKEIVEIFRTVKEGEYDAILMDVQMPNMDGLQATRMIRNGENPVGKTIPIIAMTANAFSEDVQHCLGVGMDAHIAKPIDVAVLEKTLRGFSGGEQNDQTE